MSTANRLLNVLGLFTLDRPQWTVDAAALELGLTLSTTYRYFKSLVEAGLVAADTPRHYTLGPAIIHFDRQMRLRDPLISTAAPVMQRLARTIDPEAVVLLCRLYRHQVVCVHQESLSTQDFHTRWERGEPTMSVDGVMNVLAQAAHEIEAGIAPKRVSGQAQAKLQALHAAPEAL